MLKLNLSPLLYNYFSHSFAGCLVSSKELLNAFAHESFQRKCRIDLKIVRKKFAGTLQPVVLSILDTVEPLRSLECRSSSEID